VCGGVLVTGRGVDVCAHSTLLTSADCVPAVAAHAVISHCLLALVTAVVWSVSCPAAPKPLPPPTPEPSPLLPLLSLSPPPPSLHTHHEQAEVAFNLGLIDTRQRREAEAIQFEVVELVRNRQWTAARRRSDELLAYITTASASATLEDIRRDKAYDAEDRVSTYLNLPGGRQLGRQRLCLLARQGWGVWTRGSCSCAGGVRHAHPA
jgi:hypothetical protein